MENNLLTIGQVASQRLSIKLTQKSRQNHHLAITIASKIKFASIVVEPFDEYDIIFAPFTLFSQQEQLVVFKGHLAVYNPLHGLLKQGPVKARLIFTAVNEQVECINTKTKQKYKQRAYLGCEFQGTLSKVLDQDQFLDLLQKEVDDFESEIGSEWRLKDTPPDYRQRLQNGIFGIKFKTKQWRLLQNIISLQKKSKRAIQNLAKSPELSNSTHFWMNTS